MIINDSKKNFWTIIISAIIAITIASVVIFWKLGISNQNYFMPKQSDYLISGVPYVGIFNHTGAFGQLASDQDSAVASVLEYWNPGKNDFRKIKSDISNLASGDSYMIALVSYINGYSDMHAELKNLKLEDLGNYVSPVARTPLIAFFAFSSDQPQEAAYFSARVLIGIKWPERKLIFHDYWLGNNSEISFDEYSKLLDATHPSLRNSYLVIQPKDLSGKIRQMKSQNAASYPARTVVMNKNGEMFRDYALAWPLHQAGRDDLALSYSSRVVNNTDFEEFFPPEYKVRVWCELAQMKLDKGDQGGALRDAQKSVELNHNLDKPFKDWPGYELRTNAPSHFGEITMAYRIQGDIFLAMKDFKSAHESYNKALEIRPDNDLATKGLVAAEAALGKK